MATKTKTKSKKIKITVGKAQRYDGRVGVVSSALSSSGTVRHITTSLNMVEPICAEQGPYYGRWIASTGKKAHELPLCKKCKNVITKINQAIENHPSTVDEETRFEESKAGLMAIIEEYGEYEGDDDDG